MKTNTMKKKTGLLVIAALMVVVLAVSGTLMLFTAQSDTATNVVTLGKAKIELQEKGVKKDGTVVDWTKVETGKFTGIEHGTEYAAKAKIEKAAKIKNTGSVPVYAFIKLDFTIKKNGSPVDFSENGAFEKYFGTGATSDNLTQFYADLEAGINLSSDWVGLIKPKLSAKGSTLNTGYFYVEGPNTTPEGRQLKVLVKGADTSELFDKVQLPDVSGDAWDGVTFELKLTGYAVQSDNNPYKKGVYTGSGSTKTGDVRAKAFADLKAEIGLGDNFL